VRSLLSFQLLVEGKNFGALNSYGADTGAFNEESILIGEVLAEHASVALAGTTAAFQFHTATPSESLACSVGLSLMVWYETTPVGDDVRD
jgi:hypothetical protein